MAKSAEEKSRDDWRIISFMDTFKTLFNHAVVMNPTSRSEHLNGLRLSGKIQTTLPNVGGDGLKATHPFPQRNPIIKVYIWAAESTWPVRRGPDAMTGPPGGRSAL
jgi:hypothetical protein